MPAPQFRSRYTDADVSHLLPENQLDPLNPTNYQILVSYLKCFCGTRRRFLITLVGLISLSMLFRNMPSVYHFMDEHSHHLSVRQSMGYVSEPKYRWEERKNFLDFVRESQDSNDILEGRNVAAWYRDHWRVDFECPREEAFGEMEEQWYVCHPLALLKKRRQQRCLIYTSRDTSGDFVFEMSLLEKLVREGGQCEVHVFDPGAKDYQVIEVTNHELNDKPQEQQSQLLPYEGNKTASNHTDTLKSTIHVHPWGFKSSTNRRILRRRRDKNDIADTSHNGNDDGKMKTFSETIQELNHKKRTISILAIDCNGCEWSVYPDLFNVRATGVTIDQFLVRLHGAPGQTVNDFFKHVYGKNYVTFHREPEVWEKGDGGGGVMDGAWRYSFMKLRKDFFKGTRAKVDG